MIITRSRKDCAKASRADAAATEMMIHSGGIPYLTFSAGHTTYALYIASTTAIVDAPLIAADPRLPEFVKGALHLDGGVIPVIDMASRLGFPTARPGRRTCVVLVQAHLADKDIPIGVEVDAVHEVLNLSEPGLDAPPSCGANLNSHFVDVMAKRPGHYAMVMHVEQLLFSEELTELASLGELRDDIVHH